MCKDCEVLHEQLQKQAGEMFGLRRAVIRLRGELKRERRKITEITKEKQQKQKPTLRKGQKRGARGFHG